MIKGTEEVKELLNVVIRYKHYDCILYLECVSPLGMHMEDNSIKVSQIIASAVTEVPGAYGWYARLNFVWAEWCPDTSGSKITERNYDQYIQIDLLNLTQIIGIATQGGEYNGSAYAKDYKISYTRDGGVWYFYREKNQAVKVNIWLTF